MKTLQKMTILWLLPLMLTSMSAGAEYDANRFEKAVRRFYSGSFSVDNPTLHIDAPPDFPACEGAKVEFSAKGNGILQIKNLSLRVFDDHHNGIYYDKGVLQVEFLKDIHGMECVVVRGIVILEGDKEAVLDRKPLLLVYKFNKQNSRFERAVAIVPFAEENYLLEKL